MRWTTLALVAASLTGCADYQLTNARYERYDGVQPTDDWESSATLRLDVHPDQIDAEQPLLSQSFWVPLHDGNLTSSPLDLRLSKSVLVSGYVSAYQVSPWSGADLPGQDVAVRAEVSLHLKDSAQSTVVSTDPGDGWFETRVVPDEGYTLAVSPDSPEVPAALLEVDALDDLDLDLDLGQGTPLYGRVTLDDGSPMVGARVYATSGPVQTAASLTDQEGWYLLRVQDNLDWSLVCTGRDDGRDPTLTTDTLAVSGDHLRHDLTYGPLDKVVISGRVLDASGLPAKQARVRLVAESLDGFPEGTQHEPDGSTGSNGNFDILVVPGTWTLEILPEESELATSSSSRSPVALEALEVDEAVDLGRIDLPAYTSLSGIVTDPDGVPVAGAGLHLTEVGFNSRSWASYTEDDGTFTVEVPQVDLMITLTPPPDRANVLATTRLSLNPSEVTEPELRIEQGQRLRGIVRAPEGEALPYALIEVHSDADALLAVTVTDGEGRFDVGVAP